MQAVLSDHDAQIGPALCPAGLNDIPTRKSGSLFGGPGKQAIVVPKSFPAAGVNTIDEEEEAESECLKPEETSPLGFDVKYYGPCPTLTNVPVDEKGVLMIDQEDVETIIADKRLEEDKTGKKTCYRTQIFFSKHGVSISDPADGNTMIAWNTIEVIRLDTVHVGRWKSKSWFDDWWYGTERVAMLKVFNKERKIEWHLLKYVTASASIDNMVQSFRDLFDYGVQLQNSTPKMTPLYDAARSQTPSDEQSWKPTASKRVLSMDAFDAAAGIKL